MKKGPYVENTTGMDLNRRKAEVPAPRNCFLSRELKDGKRRPEWELQEEARSGAESRSFFMVHITAWSILLGWRRQREKGVCRLMKLYFGGRIIR